MQGKSAQAALGVIAALVMVPLLVLMMLLSAGGNTPAGACTVPGVAVDAGKIPAGSIGGYKGKQLENAATIIGVAKGLGLPQAAQIIGVQGAMGECQLNVCGYGDAAGPDSRGLFQQRDNGAWGSYSDRMDPKISSTNFFKALQKVAGWESLEPSLAINRVQRNDDPTYYQQYRDRAVQVFEALTGAVVAGGGQCTGSGKVVGTPTGKWVYPLDSPQASMTSPYGPRKTPAGTADINNNYHYGVDLSAPGSPQVLAPTDMKITRATAASQDTWGAGENVAGTSLDGQYSFALMHMVAGSLKVQVGDVVAAGTPLGLMGATGNVSGAHTHLEIYVPARENPVPAQGTVDPVPILQKAGAWK